MSHLGARVLKVLKEDRPYEIRDTDGHPISKDEAKRLILEKYHVSEEIRQERRRRNNKSRQIGRANGKDKGDSDLQGKRDSKAPQPV
jgi:hypothetical protein